MYMVRTKMNEYEIIDHLGSGSFGNVVLVKKDGVEYANKMILMPDIITSLTEVSLLTSMSHPHIVKPYKYIKEGRHINIIMKKMKSSLSAMEDKASIDLRLFLWQMLSAIDYMHKNGVIHADLKLGNIMMDDSNYPMIIDLGLAIYRPFSTPPLHIDVQTPGYKAPEVLAGEPYDDKIDIFSMGIVMYRLLLDERPFDPDGWYIEQVDIDDALSYIGDIQPDTIEYMVQLMLTLDPRKRPSAEELMKMPYFEGLGYHTPDKIKFNDNFDPVPNRAFDTLGIKNLLRRRSFDKDVIDYTRAMFKRSGLLKMDNYVRAIMLYIVSAINEPTQSNIDTMYDLVRIGRHDDEIYDLLVALNMTIF